MTTELLNAALSHLHAGHSVIPIGRDKKPSIKTWAKYQTERASDAQVSEWLGQRGVTGIAVVGGEVSGGFAARDFDVPEAYERWAESHPSLAKELPTAATNRGWHVYFRTEREMYVKGSDGELRGDHRYYTIVPPSKHPTGASYAYVIPPKGELPVLDPVECDLMPEGVNFQTVQAKSHTSTMTSDSSLIVSDSSLNLSESDLESVPESLSVSPVVRLSVDEVLGMTQPATVGERNARLFDLARGLRFNCGLAGSKPSELKHIVKRWHEKALPVIGSKNFLETMSDFLRGFDLAREPLGQTRISDAFAIAACESDNIALESVIAELGDEAFGVLARACWQLARCHPQRRFFLSSHDAAQRLQINQTKSFEWLKLMQVFELLEQVEKGKAGRANRYRWIGPDTEARPETQTIPGDLTRVVQ